MRTAMFAAWMILMSAGVMSPMIVAAVLPTKTRAIVFTLGMWVFFIIYTVVTIKTAQWWSHPKG